MEMLHNNWMEKKRGVGVDIPDAIQVNLPMNIDVVWVNE